MEPSTNQRVPTWGIYVASLLLIGVILGFVAVLVRLGVSDDQPPETLTPNTYMDKVSALLANADPANGDRLIDQYECHVCHRGTSANVIAPSYVGIAERAAARRPPLTAAAYIYESITHPTAFIVSGFAAAMPQNYAERLSDRELGDIIAYLLTPDTH